MSQETVWEDVEIKQLKRKRKRRNPVYCYEDELDTLTHFCRMNGRASVSESHQEWRWLIARHCLAHREEGVERGNEETQGERCNIIPLISLVAHTQEQDVHDVFRGSDGHVDRWDPLNNQKTIISKEMLQCCKEMHCNWDHTTIPSTHTSFITF